MSQKAEYINEIAKGFDKFKLPQKLEFACILDPNNPHLIRTDILITSQMMKGHTYIYCPKHKDYIDITCVEPNGFVRG